MKKYFWLNRMPVGFERTAFSLGCAGVISVLIVGCNPEAKPRAAVAPAVVGAERELSQGEAKAILDASPVFGRSTAGENSTAGGDLNDELPPALPAPTRAPESKPITDERPTPAPTRMPEPTATPAPTSAPAVEGEHSFRTSLFCSDTWTTIANGKNLENSNSLTVQLLDSNDGSTVVIESGERVRQRLMERKYSIPLKGYKGLKLNHNYVLQFLAGSTDLAKYPFSTNYWAQGFQAISTSELKSTRSNIVTKILYSSNTSPVPMRPENCDERTSPLAIQMNQQGLQFSTAEAGVEFDLFGLFRMLADGFKYRYAWSQQVFWLALPDARGSVHSIRQLFGDMTEVLDEQGQPMPAGDGFQALQQHDRNHDQKIDAKDPVFHRLVLWVDADGNGRSEARELKRLTAYGIQSISLRVDTDHYEKDPVSGVEAIGKSLVRMRDGSHKVMTDLWLPRVRILE